MPTRELMYAPSRFGKKPLTILNGSRKNSRQMRSVPLWIHRSPAGGHRFSKEGYGRQRSWIREGAEEEGGNEPDEDGFTKLTKAEQLELPFDLPDREKG